MTALTLFGCAAATKVPVRRGFDRLVTLPFMLPGTCFGIGYILAFNHPPLRLTGTALIVLTNMLFKQLPSCPKICSAMIQQIPKAQELADRIAIMEQGNLIQYGTPMEIFWRPFNRFVWPFLNLDDLIWEPDGRLLKVIKK